MDHVFDIDLWPCEPFPSINGKPQDCETQNAAIDEAGIVHVEGIEIVSSGSRKTQNGDNEQAPRTCDNAARTRETSQVPRTLATGQSKEGAFRRNTCLDETSC